MFEKDTADTVAALKTATFLCPLSSFTAPFQLNLDVCLACPRPRPPPPLSPVWLLLT